MSKWNVSTFFNKRIKQSGTLNTPVSQSCPERPVWPPFPLNPTNHHPWTTFAPPTSSARERVQGRLLGARGFQVLHDGGPESCGQVKQSGERRRSLHSYLCLHRRRCPDSYVTVRAFGDTFSYSGNLLNIELVLKVALTGGEALQICKCTH